MRGEDPCTNSYYQWGVQVQGRNRLKKHGSSLEESTLHKIYLYIDQATSGIQFDFCFEKIESAKETALPRSAVKMM
jgi:hypothetical protein